MCLPTKSELYQLCRSIRGDPNEGHQDSQTGTESEVLTAITGHVQTPPERDTSRHYWKRPNTSERDTSRLRREDNSTPHHYHTQ
ncbi:hypothetical protein AVEN_144658-1 [Araneus ventricosus]|uniref:Uncharacterized protein n=1 Tax=Araneus ventricosus TaxID=182803 RepID=A0A4Y2E357_ARAVE|nr:hypothetical protein AVEN_144658-1 [Araneus ventricosus]